jgi:hypothetical protein
VVCVQTKPGGWFVGFGLIGAIGMIASLFMNRTRTHWQCRSCGAVCSLPTAADVQRQGSDLAGRLVVDAILSAAVAEAKRQRPSASTTDSTALGPGVIDPNNLVDYRHGAKIQVFHPPNSNETTLLHNIPTYDEYAPPFKPDLTVDGETIKGRHVFGFHDSVTFSGRKLTAIPINICCNWVHKIADPNEWHYPPKARVIISADNDRFEISVYRQFELSKDKPSDAEFSELLITKPTYEMYVKLASAKNVTVQIGTASFSLDPEVIASYRDFVAYLTPGIN